jgi:hypothetical protein
VDEPRAEKPEDTWRLGSLFDERGRQIKGCKAAGRILLSST